MKRPVSAGPDESLEIKFARIDGAIKEEDKQVGCVEALDEIVEAELTKASEATVLAPPVEQQQVDVADPHLENAPTGNTEHRIRGSRPVLKSVAWGVILSQVVVVVYSAFRYCDGLLVVCGVSAFACAVGVLWALRQSST